MKSFKVTIYVTTMINVLKEEISDDIEAIISDDSSYLVLKAITVEEIENDHDNAE